MLVDGTWTKVKSQRACYINVSQRFLLFWVVLITLMYVQVFILGGGGGGAMIDS